MIKPTVGRVVWYQPDSAERIKGEPHDQVCAAIITYVWSDTMVNLMVMTPNGVPYGVTSVALVQEGAKYGGRWCTWMPYQKAVAKGEIAPTLHAT
jgi:hypothetical protein